MLSGFLLQIYWDINPEIFRIGGFGIRYYSLFFGLAFYFSYLILVKIYTKENVSVDLLSTLTIYVFLGTLIGARLGQVFFYEFGYYQNHLLEIILPFRVDPKTGFEFTGFQGLASHGGAIGILTALFFYCRKYHQSFFWIADRLAIVVPLAGFFIRLGNLFNSEIIGKPFNGKWAFVFTRVDRLARHPTQLYEAFGYLIVFCIMMIIYNKKNKQFNRGFLFGLFLVLVFSVRFIVEFYKENQESFENAMPINMGQVLSIPLILIGLYLIFKNGKIPVNQFV
ncbi:prolipoprotein diacylglyceryl transferase [Pedobacter nutrimenti]|uniref:Phosphatidylglycerol--prolipoprotein diacylglyceryl transferase n=1 Tax=Pedobacter nutrimenti TaxID=1241337 RepID=A0A318UKZ1_9SPHI|nr:prolipoprotein diacylglyceryl transferase [Pedobacter nutrimenti]PYF74675.1 prolipoprotein diacylglyceryl transferase [Pedobacter nutrimenti]